MLIDISVACTWIAMSLAGAIGLGSLRRFGSNLTLAVELSCGGEEISPEELYSLEPPAIAGLVG